MEHIDCLVIGAGVIGLAVARELARAGREVLIVERENRIGVGTSSRNSEVIHAGIYYDQWSLMARFCVEGRRALYHFCEERGVPHRRCGKLIVATSREESSKLSAIKARAAANGVEDLVEISISTARDLEPALHCEGALLSPSTGIIDSHAFMLALLADAESFGAVVALNSPVVAARVVDDGLEVDFAGSDPITLCCNLCINAAGLHAPDLVREIAGYPANLAPRAHYAKGNYFALAGHSPFSRLIYPVPVPGGLGTHLTIDLLGQARFGPDVEWVDKIDYSVDPARALEFYASIRRFWPDIKDGQLQPAYAGIRPKIVPKEIGRQDFVVQGRECHGIPNLINLFGIESPGLTASLALAAYVAKLARE
ncbi:NAD(P)/FAD-dependent oxidoreductase [uncultured Rhodoblastus sp.]|uniref:NAD(P)/FAD-dependent oxidoreductase n=1 Tax=uncultured Rhodoblastus sp. TaxID=543037 RepID=UPI0025F1D9ED|nr:NAD(P)/FAD-dependent oxidoreductase [uncultured Rhodoblastus sp.]